MAKAILTIVMAQCLGALAGCPLGHFEKGDPSTCVPTLALAIAAIPQPNVTITRDEGEKGASEIVTFQLKLGDLPAPGSYFEDDDIKYVIDMKVLDSEVSPQSDPNEDQECRSIWLAALASPTDLGNGYFSVQIERSYTELSIDCRLDAENTGDGLIERAGVVAIYIVSTSNADPTPTQGRTAGEYVERAWLRYVTVTFEVTTVDHLGIHIGDIDFSDRFNRSFHLGGFESSLTLYESTGFATARANHSYEVGAAVHVDHSLDVSSDDLDLAVQSVYLSASCTLTFPGDEAEVVHDMSLQLHERPSALSQARFTFIARRCENCCLHVVSKVVHQDRRLAGSRQLQEAEGEVYTMQTLTAEIKPPAVFPADGPLVHLSMVVRGVDYSALVASVSLRTRFIAELTVPVVSRMGNGIGPEHIMVTLSPGSVNAHVAIRVPAGADLSAVRATIEAPAFQATLEDDVTRSLVAVEGIYSVAHGTVSTDLTAVEVTERWEEPGGAAQGAAPGLGPLEVAVIAAAAACLVGVLACTVFLCRHARGASPRKADEGPKAVESQAPNAASPDVAEVQV